MSAAWRLCSYGIAHVLDAGFPHSCHSEAREVRPLTPRDLGVVPLCAACIAAIQSARVEREAPPVEECTCECCRKSSVQRAHHEEMLASLCPGCHAVGGERCAPHCIDDEIRRDAEDDARVDHIALEDEEEDVAE